MRHYKKGRKLGTDASHTKAIKKSLVVALFTNDRIKTTLERAKEIRGDVDRIITLAKRGDVHARRLAIARLGNKDLVAEIFLKVEQGLFQGREGGYTRILKLGKRRGDSVVIVILELVQEPVTKKDKAAGETEKAATGKPAAKAKTAEKHAEAVEASDDEVDGADVSGDDLEDVVTEESVEINDDDDDVVTEEVVEIDDDDDVVTEEVVEIDDDAEAGVVTEETVEVDDEGEASEGESPKEDSDASEGDSPKDESDESAAAAADITASAQD